MKNLVILIVASILSGVVIGEPYKLPDPLPAPDQIVFGGKTYVPADTNEVPNLPNFENCIWFYDLDGAVIKIQELEPTKHRFFNVAPDYQPVYTYEDYMKVPIEYRFGYEVLFEATNSINKVYCHPEDYSRIATNRIEYMLDFYAFADGMLTNAEISATYSHGDGHGEYALFPIKVDSEWDAIYGPYGVLRYVNSSTFVYEYSEDAYGDTIQPFVYHLRRYSPVKPREKSNYSLIFIK